MQVAKRFRRNGDDAVARQRERYQLCCSREVACEWAMGNGERVC